MKFVHIADCHLGSWREPKMQELCIRAFCSAIDECIKRKADFVLIAGDIFDSAIPPIDVLKITVEKFRQLNEAGIPCYIIHGSHDFSASGKSMLSVLEKTRFCKDVNNKIIEKDDYSIFGIEGKKGSLEKEDIKSLKINPKKNFNILLLHTSVRELLPSELSFMHSLSLDELPKNFDYYALGHIHENAIEKRGKKFYVYPGCLFPNNFSELEKKQGSFVFFDNGKIEKIKTETKEIASMNFNANGKSATILSREITEKILESNISDCILTMRIEGILESGKPSEIDFEKISKETEKKNCYCLLRNTSKLNAKELELKIEEEARNVEEIENAVIGENIKEKEKREMFFVLMQAFEKEKQEGETSMTFSKRVEVDTMKVLEIEKEWQ